MTYSYHRPATVAEACQMAAELDDARFIAGGTDLMVQLGQRRKQVSALISVRRLAELTTIEVGETIRIGACVPLDEIETHPAIRRELPALAEAIHWLGSRQIRNVATLGGNLCNASPAADTAPPLLVYGADVEITDGEKTRTVPLRDFFLEPGRTALEAGEMLTAVTASPPKGARSAFLRKGRVKMDLAIVNVAALADDTGVRVAAGAVAPTPLRLEGIENLIEAAGPRMWEQIRTRVSEEISPIDDLRSSSDYRRHLTGVLVERALKEVLSERRGRT